MKKYYWGFLGFLFCLGCATTQQNSPASSPVSSSAGTPQVTRQIASTIPRDGLNYLKTLSMDQLAELFAGGTAERVPHGDSQGLPIISTDATILGSMANFFWNGKQFTATSKTQGTLVNNLALNELHWINAKVVIGDVRRVLRTNATGMKRYLDLDEKIYPFDGKPSIILDYHHSLVLAARGIVDEVRRVLPDQFPALFLGRATMNGNFVVYFALQFDPSALLPLPSERVSP